MIRSSLPTALAGLILFVVPLSAADLTQLDRKIIKEPAYKSKPKYCLLVFGAEAKTRVWLVLDGDALYIDRNGNGDLTEPGEKVQARKGDEDQARDGVFFFEAGDISDGKQTHKGLTLSVSKLDHLADLDSRVKTFLTRNPRARGYRLGIDVAMPGWKGAGLGGRVQHIVANTDVNGILQFSERPDEAPIIHLGGPWQIALYGPHQLTIGREEDMVLSVGTPGLGAGTTAYVGYEELIPEKAHPTVTITYPTKPGQTPLREHYELKRRC
jgi:hypothetical protein